MKKRYLILTVFTLVLSFITCSMSVLADNSEETPVSIGFTKDTELKPDKPTVVPPTGGDQSGEPPKTSHTAGRLPQTGELINYWLMFNGIFLLIMIWFIFVISKRKNNEKDVYLA